jgi:hypothetical protein
MSPSIPGGSDERVYRGKPQLALYLPLLLGSAAVLGVALELGLGTGIRTALNTTPVAARSVAPWLGISAGVLIFFVLGCWYADLRWVSLSRDGIHWWVNGSVQFRPWYDVDRVEHSAFKMRDDGRRDEPPPGRWVEIHFRSGARLHLSDAIVVNYQELVATIDVNSAHRLIGGFNC